MVEPDCNQNVFQLWKRNEEALPFKVIRWTWNPETVFLVERVEISNWPYGKARGYFIRHGVRGAPQQLPNAGSYQWKFVP